MKTAKNPMVRTITTILDQRHFLECPRWHRDRLWFVDLYSCEVLSVAEDGTDLRVEAYVPGQPSGLGWLPDGRLLVVSMRDRRILRREPDGELITHADLSDLATGNLNDMVVDAHGRAYVGNFGFDLMAHEPIQAAALVRVDPDGTATTVADGLLFPNGSAITDDDVLLVGESFGNRISAFDIAADGSLGSRQDWARFGEPPSATELETAFSQLVIGPDGCALDAEGALWIADGIGGRLVRVAPGGEILEEIHPGTGVFACMLGGRDGRTLYACVAPDFHEEHRRAARDGSLVAVRVDVPGAGRP
ncbi:SMP-30/gluconolactonase/LRE family protein [Arthrobacter sp. M4]|uniref:SMP-30/gluconolactonase/LRE family protein n=1 Tax=Arthrobacter sp. M4 TaxID=218160 RepID=UPI001CDD0FCA|nr:SMP-30/gluconolactonase/LRE family protein [Arthrobacter sp. M4]MCA4135690.1 SMP-30/gluconolactonase/LRE family protein [Arthrobacter sp. M4]